MRRLALALLVLPHAGVHGQARDATTRTVDELARCRAIAADAERLACFDRAADQVASARRRGDLLVLDRQGVVERKQRRFGLPNPSGDVFGGGAADQATRVTELNTTVRAAVPASSYGRWDLQLADGSVWQSTEPVRVDPKPGRPIRVKAAALGAFTASVANGPTFKVKRIR